MPAIKMPSSEDIDKAYLDGAKRAPARYKKKVEQDTKWHDAAMGGQKKYEDKMSNPDVLKRRAQKLETVTQEEWKRRTLKLGPERIGKGMEANADKRKRNYEPVRAGLDGFEIPDSVADTDTNIDNRLKPVVHKMQEAAGKR